MAAGNGVAAAFDLQQTLAAAEPRGPAGLPSADPGAVLALACHCVMVHAGFRPARPGGDGPAKQWAPAAGWATEFKDEWVFKYTVPGKRNTLALHCSLQRASGRMLVHTIEVGAPANSHLLGLQLDKYVPDASRLRSASWDGVVCQGAIAQMMSEHSIQPLLDAAEDLPLGAASASGEWPAAAAQGSWLAWLSGAPAGPGGGRSYVLPGVLLAGVAVAAVAVYAASRRRRL